MKLNLSATTTSALLIAFSAHTQAAISLGTAADFRVLAGSTITNTGLTVVDGSIGVDPGTAITGFFAIDGGSGIYTGTAHQGGVTVAQAKADANTAFNDINALNMSLTTLGAELGGETLNPGTYELGSAGITGILTLDGAGDYYFQISSTLITATGSSVLLINGAEASNVFWAVGSSATLDTGTAFAGNIIAAESITFLTGSSLNGRAIALNAAVTLDSNTIIPEPSTMSLLAFLSIGFISRRRRGTR